MEDFNNQRLHVIVDDSDDCEDDEGYMAAPASYETGRVSSYSEYDFQPGAMMLEHREQHHNYDSQGRFQGYLSSSADRQVHQGVSGHSTLHHLQAPSLHDEGQMYCCCFAPPGSMPRCCMDSASCNSNNFGGVSSPATAEDGVLQVTELIAFRKAAQMTRTIGAMVIKRQAAVINHQLLQMQQFQEDDEISSRSDDCIPPRRNSIDESRPSKRQRNDDSIVEESYSRLDGKKCDLETARSIETCNTPTRPSPEATFQAAAAIQASPNSRNFRSEHISSNHGSLVNSSTGTTNSNATTGTVYSEYPSVLRPDEAAARIWYQVDRMKRMSMFLKNAQLAQSLLLEEMKDCYCSTTHEGRQETCDSEDLSREESDVNSDSVSHHNEV